MKEFSSWQSFFRFQQDVTKLNRYILSLDSQDFLNTVLATAENRIEKVPEGTIFWRAQLGNTSEPYHQDGEYMDDIPAPFSPERMKPFDCQAYEGRANPKGIPFLYLATRRDTALSEVRPWLGSYISVANFKILKELNIVNCTSSENRNLIYLEEPSAEEKEKAVWVDIDKAFSSPVNPNDKIADYVPTQILAEFFKNNHFDGVAYRSALGEGHNLALFDISSAELLNCSLYETKKLMYCFEPASNTYFLKKN